MSFCSSCGAQNTDDARFCNKCGTQMGAATTAPPVAPPAPMNTGGTVTLAGIGIQSPSKTYAVLGVGAAVFLALGAVLAYVGMHSGGTPPSTTSGALADATDPSGGAIPAGVDVPEDDFVMSGGARVVKRGPSAGTTGGTTTGTTGTSTGTTGGTTPPPSTTTPGQTPPTTRTTSASHTGSTGSTGTTGSTGSTTHGTTPIDPPPSGTTGGGTPPPTSAVDWDSMSGTVPGDGQDEPDYQMQMYSTQVRRFIRQYLLPQSTSCFEHASATSRDAVRGTVAIGFDIDARGHAQSASVDRNTTGVDSLARCLQNNVNSWQLPPPPAGTAPIQMQMPFTR